VAATLVRRGSVEDPEVASGGFFAFLLVAWITSSYSV
jgi:hypothetical protein